MVGDTIELGISLLRGGNVEVQKVKCLKQSDLGKEKKKMIVDKEKHFNYIR